MDEQTVILYADDELTARHMVRTALEKHGYCVIQAKNGQEAVTMATRKQPHLILLDCRMPDLDGLSVVDALHAKEDTRDIPIVIVSAMRDSAHVEGALARGVASYVGKPYETQKLVKEVRRVLRSRSKPGPSASAENP